MHDNKDAMKTKTILVVEDEPIVGLEMQESLQRMGYSVPEIVTSGDQVLDATLRLKPDLIIMDIHLNSFIDGIDAAMRLKLLGGCPIVYVTAYPNAQIRERAMRTSPAAYLLKPLDEDELRKAVADGLK